MRKLLATLNVYEDDTPGNGDDGGSFMQGSPFDDKHYRIVLFPNKDNKMFKGAEKPENQATILAHELGHFVSHVMGEPQADPILAHFIGGKHLLDAEEKAWEHANNIRPSLNKDIEKLALDSYRKGIKKNEKSWPGWSGWPMGRMGR